MFEFDKQNRIFKEREVLTCSTIICRIIEEENGVSAVEIEKISESQIQLKEELT
jgi:hypothetical protein